MVKVLAELIGKKFDFVLNVDNKEILFISETEGSYRLFQEQERYEDVYIEDIIGELTDLAVSKITVAESVTDSVFKFETVKGSVTITFNSNKIKLVRFQ